MAVAFIQEWRDATDGTDNYDAIGERLGADQDPPEGLIVHTAGWDAQDVFRIFDVWESGEAARRFHDERLMPVVNELMRERGESMTPPDIEEMYELHDVIHPGTTVTTGRTA